MPSERLIDKNIILMKRVQKSILGLQLIKLESKVYPHMDHMGAAISSFEDAIKALFGNTEMEK